ncbi:MAG: ATP-binding cassette domain-containing protein [Chloroflexi bacterium]|nr:ATP-binding cassette domain-containing protein [Chloroflexota bacterium]
MTLLTIEGVHKRFRLHHLGGRTIVGLDGVSLGVATGEHVALAGPSGSGKSSLLKCVYRTYRPDSGSVRLAGAELTALPDDELADLREHQLGYVSQFLRAEPRRTAFDVVVRSARRRGLDRGQAADAAAEALRRVRIPEDLWGTYPTLLSGGEKQRVNLAAGTVRPPRLLLLDEPVSALDPANREAVLELIAGLAAQGVAVLAVFHDLDAMHRLADRVIVLQRGRVVAEGPPAEVLSPESIEVAL